MEIRKVQSTEQQSRKHWPSAESGEEIDERSRTLSKYGNIIQDQLKMGIVEIAPNTTQGTGFYLPHTLAVRREAETTKVCVVYKESVRKNQTAPSLNDVLETGPSPHNLI